MQRLDSWERLRYSEPHCEAYQGLCHVGRAVNLTPRRGAGGDEGESCNPRSNKNHRVNQASLPH
jgi:hypothetical protein